ncbi:hypothetical protein HXX76_004990 [Chlamydomonas incerta]|uniref:Uncharacterized protein n=1 Tax=Chlamydomonas incerta TaxID=51695 RepID=A0A835TG13_CHLIN|nr:hypothetical protein HXX76_004990 [Chlamydomonas incerta]|eukprot:KAG2439639.1 hypothetical protein HXX76_004990 [Chlamydomonas incerta]
MPGRSLPTPMRRPTDVGAAQTPAEQAHGACTCSQCTCSPCTCGQAATRSAELSGSSGDGNNKPIYRTTGGAGALGTYAPPRMVNTGNSNSVNAGTGDAYQQMAQQAPPGAEGLQSRAPGGAGVTGSYGPLSSAFPPQVPAGAAGGLADEVDAAAEGIVISRL